MVQLERLKAADFAPRKDLVYVDVAGLLPIYEKVAFRGNHILVGPKGIGKSLSAQVFAASIDCPVVTFDCSEDVRRSHLIGTFIIRGRETPYILGPVPTAFDIANEVGRCILILEEINALTPQMQKVLNPAADFRRQIVVPEAEKVFRLEKEAKLWIIGTMNFSVYGGVYSLNEDLKSRFRMIPTSYPRRADEVLILERLLDTTPGAKKAVGKAVLQKLVLLAHETRQGALDYSLSTRDLYQIAEDILDMGLQEALRISTGKFEGEDVVAYKKRIESIFDEVRFTSDDQDEFAIAG